MDYLFLLFKNMQQNMSETAMSAKNCSWVEICWESALCEGLLSPGGDESLSQLCSVLHASAVDDECYVYSRIVVFLAFSLLLCVCCL